MRLKSPKFSKLSFLLSQINKLLSSTIIGFGKETQLVAAGEDDVSLTIKVDVFSEEIIGKEV